MKSQKIMILAIFHHILYMYSMCMYTSTVCQPDACPCPCQPAAPISPQSTPTPSPFRPTIRSSPNHDDQILCLYCTCTHHQKTERHKQNITLSQTKCSCELGHHIRQELPTLASFLFACYLLPWILNNSSTEDTKNPTIISTSPPAATLGKLNIKKPTTKFLNLHF